jgi:uncharacterized protein YbjT (DUF2867 family)
LTSLRVAVAGASGFVGAHLMKALAERGGEVIALSRSKPTELLRGAVWRETDLFSATSTAAALEGVDCAIYLVHSMLPSTTLFQGSFHDTDLLLADNFARAARARGVKRIIYLGGLVPEGYISQHLESRREVEDVLRETGVPVTVLRAGMIVGPGGSSFGILESLVRRLPVMVLPAWTQRRTQAIFIDDVVSVVAAAAFDAAFSGRTLDLVNGESLHYETLLRRMAEVLGKRRPMVHVPIESTGFSKLWVTLFGSSSYSLVSPLIDSLLCDLPASHPDPLIAPLIRFRTFKSMALEALSRTRGPEAGAVPSRKARRRPSRKWRTVRSIQRLPAISGQDGDWIAQEYLRWLPGAFVRLIEVRSDEVSGRVEFRIRGLPFELLVLERQEGDLFAELFERNGQRDRAKLHIVGGVLSRTRNTGWLEFRQVENRKYTLAAIHEFVPRLPWPIYLLTQAPLHAWTMRRFGEHLLRCWTPFT